MIDSNIITWLPLIIIIFVYFVVAFVKPRIQTWLPLRLCAICVGVSSAWVILLALWLLGVFVSTTILGILMGMSIVGIMYSMQRLYEKKKIKNFWFVRLVVIIGGLYLVIAILEKQWQLSFLLGIVILFSILIPSLLFQGITHEDVVQEQKKKGRAANLIKKLDNCC